MQGLQRATQPRPLAITVFGALDILFGALGLLWSTTLREPGSLMKLDGGGIVFYGLTMIALTIAGIGLLRLRPWGRKLAMCICVLKLAVAAFIAVCTIVVCSFVPGGGLSPPVIAFMCYLLIGSSFYFLQFKWLNRPLLISAFLENVAVATIEENLDHPD